MSLIMMFVIGKSRMVSSQGSYLHGQRLFLNRLQSLRDRVVQAGRHFPPATPPGKPRLVFKALGMLTWELPCPFSHPDPPRVPPHARCLPTPPPQKMSASLFLAEAGQERRV